MTNAINDEAAKAMRDGEKLLEELRRCWRLVFVAGQVLFGRARRTPAGEQTLEPVYVFLSNLQIVKQKVDTPLGPQVAMRPILQQEIVPVCMLQSIRRVFVPLDAAYVPCAELDDVDLVLLATKLSEIQEAIAVAKKVDEQSLLVKP